MNSTNPKYEVVEVNLPNTPYPILIGAGVRKQFGEYFQKYGKGRAFWITDRNVADSWGEDLGGLCTKSATDIIIIPPGEDQKRLLTVERIAQILLQMGAERGDTLIACGGGVVGDIVGFTAACYQRGITFVQIPTTLLAMVDASVGGKTGVDLPEGKNLIGAFHQPRFVLIDLDFLKTLDEREFRSGYAEVVKTALIGDADLYNFLKSDEIGRFFEHDPVTLCEVITKCVSFKRDIVIQDEREKDLRRILNFGHTFGHALEVLGEYGILRHGEAVFWGMAAAIELSRRQGIIDEKLALDIDHFLSPLLKDIPRVHFRANKLLEHIYHDKKTVDGIPSIILLEEIGKPLITKDIKEDRMSEIAEYINNRMHSAVE